jgi:hypothetical protein
MSPRWNWPKSIAVLVFSLIGSGVTHAQIHVYDPAVVARNTLTAVLQAHLLATEREQHSRLRRMAMRLSLHTNLDKYAARDVPRWRTHDFETPLFARNYNAALNYGDPAGAAYLAISHPVINGFSLLDRLGPSAQRSFAARLATLEVADAAAIAATHDTGQLRFNGRRELRAIDALENDAIDGSLDQSATAVLDKISGAVLIGARQRQARGQLLMGIVEQLLIDSKRSRDTESAQMNMQLVNLRDGREANKAFVAGAGDALRGWRQP